MGNAASRGWECAAVGACTMRPVRRQDFSYHLPEELIAQSPLAERSASRLLVMDGATGGLADRVMGDLPGYLRAGDLLVFNDTRVVAARVVGTKPSGGRVEIFLERVMMEAAGAAASGAGVGESAHSRELASAEPRRGLGREARGPEAHWSEAQGPEAQGSDAQGPEAQGPEAQGPEAQGPEAQGPEAQGSDAQGPEAQGPEAQGSGEQGSEAGRARGSEVLRRQALVQLRASKPIREGLEVTTPGGLVRVLGREEELWRVETPGDALEFFEAWGEVPLPPYIHRASDESDRERYQSIFAREKGAVAAPTASLHFDAPLVAKLEAMGVERAFVTLHVGAGTFQPLRTDDLDAHRMHAERVSVSRATWDAVWRTRATGGRVIAVGTTVVRSLESAALEIGSARAASGSADAASGDMRTTSGGTLVASGRALDSAPAWSGETRLFIRPGFEFKAVDAMVTNFHLPESTLLMLVSAFAGRENVLAAYAHAVRERYRFFSYGDAMLVTPQKTATGATTP